MPVPEEIAAAVEAEMADTEKSLEKFAEFKHLEIMKFFKFSHLPNPMLRYVSFGFATLAVAMCETLPGNAERSVAIRKLLEAKDAAVRSAL